MIGAGAVCGLATEGTYGTYEASTVWLAIVSSSLGGGPKLEQPGTLLPAAAAVSHRTRRGAIKVAEEYGGDIEFIPTFGQKGTSVMLRHMFWNAPAESGAGPYTYTYTVGYSIPGLSVQQIDGTDPTDTDVARRFDGCVVSSWEFMVSAGGFARIKCSLIAQGATDPQALAGTIAVTDGEEVIAAAATTFTWNSATLAAVDFSIKCDHSAVRTPYIGGYATAKPVPDGFAAITMSAKVYVANGDLLDAYKAGTQSDLVIAFTGTGNNSLTITGELAKLTSCTRAVDTAGILYYQCEWVCLGSATKTGVKAVLINDNNDWE
jgi:hypothetical protein